LAGKFGPGLVVYFFVVCLVHPLSGLYIGNSPFTRLDVLRFDARFDLRFDARFDARFDLRFDTRFDLRFDTRDLFLDPFIYKLKYYIL
jgi:hypothetical protein